MLKSFILATLLVTSLQTATNQVCGPNCVTCNSDGKCVVCYRSHTVDGKCDKSTPLIPNCDLINDDTFNGKICQQCKPGWTQTYTWVTPVFCNKSPIDNCFLSVDLEGIHHHIKGCLACQGGTPNEQYDTCLGQSTLPPNCLIGSFDPDAKIPDCYACKDGYNSINGRCVISRIKGCMQSNDIEQKNCMLCDYTKGYFATVDDKSCYQQ